MESKDERKLALVHWLQETCGLGNVHLQPLAGDASFRRYFRIIQPTSAFIGVDAPPATENSVAFMAIANELRACGLKTPEIYHADTTHGFMLISDFGDKTYLKSLTMENADLLYGRALQALKTLQNCQSASYPLPVFGSELMLKEWRWHKEWFLNKFLNQRLTTHDEMMLNNCYQQLVQRITAQPQVFMHRDFHSANLMVLPNDVGLLDFQDAFKGPVTYDLVSLLRDCYIHWPNEKVCHWVTQFWQQWKTQPQQASLAEFMSWFDIMGIQRHLKALMTFARKQMRDQQSHYLQYIPRTLNYLVAVSAMYPEYAPLHGFLKDRVLPAYYSQESSICVP